MKFTFASWKTGIENPASPMYEFVRAYVAGRRRIQWTEVQVEVPDQGVDPTWLKACCRAVQTLPRSDLCTLYAYSTQMFPIFNRYLRSGRQPHTLASLVHDPATEWQGGQSLLIHRGARAYVSASGLADLARFDEAMQLHPTKPASRSSKWKQVDAAYRSMRPHFTTGFLRACRYEVVKYNHAVMLFAQARQLGMAETLSTFMRLIPTFTLDAYVRLVDRFIADMDATFAKMPPTTERVTLYRGVKSHARSKITVRRTLALPWRSGWLALSETTSKTTSKTSSKTS